jgi:transposase InsO family protein
VIVSKREDSSIVFVGHLWGKLYYVNFTKVKVDPKACLVAKSNLGWLWHHRLAHVGMRNLAKLQKDEHILGLTNVVFEKDRLCSACQAGKQVGAHHPTKNIQSSSRPLKLLHMDLFGPISYISIGGNKYGLVIVHDFSRFTWVFFLQDKSEANEVVKKFIRRVKNEFELKVKNIRSDNGSEFRSTQVEEFLEKKESSMNFPLHTLLNKMALLRGRTVR